MRACVGEWGGGCMGEYVCEALREKDFVLQWRRFSGGVTGDADSLTGW